MAQNSETSSLEVKTEPTSQAESTVCRASFRAPPFWIKNPAIYFAQIESQFITAGITADNTKYHHLVAAIESEILAQVSDIILETPAEKRYETLKNRLIEQFADSEQKKLKLLLQDLQLGDRRPSQLLREMKEVSNGKVPEELLKNLWLERLPIQVQQILAKNKEDSMSMASMADKILEVTDIQSFVGAVTGNTMHKESEVNLLRKQIEVLTRKVEEMSMARAYRCI